MAAIDEMIQQWPGSAVNVLNNLGYAVLDVPSILFGMLLGKADRWPRLAGVMLAFSGAASMIRMVGSIAGSAAPSMGSIVAGVLFLAAPIPLSVALLRRV